MLCYAKSKDFIMNYYFWSNPEDPRHPGDRIILTQKAKNQIFTYTHELPMGIPSQIRFWLIHTLPSREISVLQILGH